MEVARKGDKGTHITRLQLSLNRKLTPSPALIADGHFGQKTFDAIKKYQKQNKLVSDGIAGRNTWKSLGLLTKAATAKKKGPDIITPWLDLVKAEIGTSEISTKGKHNQQILEYHSETSLGARTDEIPWCSSFANWIMLHAGYQGTNNALASSWIKWGMPVTVPYPGVITIIKRKSKESVQATGSSSGYHVAFFVSKSSNKIRLLGGNQGDTVKESGFMLRSYDIIAYRKPFPRIIGVPMNFNTKLYYA
mgnify:CR=1 FL=1